MSNEIYEIVVAKVGGKRQKVGVLYANKSVFPDMGNGEVKIGWSRVSINRGDKFDKNKGLKLAKDRSNAQSFITPPRSLSFKVNRFINRCERYYKTQIPIKAIL